MIATGGNVGLAEGIIDDPSYNIFFFFCCTSQKYSYHSCI